MGSTAFDELLRSNNGEAIVNLKIQAKDDAGVSLIFLLTGVVTLGLLAPDYLKVTIEGDVIRLKSAIESQNDSIPPRVSSIPE